MKRTGSRKGVILGQESSSDVEHVWIKAGQRRDDVVVEFTGDSTVLATLTPSNPNKLRGTAKFERVQSGK